MARELFAAGFVSCWSELDEGMQEQLVRSLEAALASPTIPPDIVTTLLNLAEFMEHDEKALPLDTRCACAQRVAGVRVRPLRPWSVAIPAGRPPTEPPHDARVCVCRGGGV